jgi:hypothetical protein
MKPVACHTERSEGFGFFLEAKQENPDPWLRSG